MQSKHFCMVCLQNFLKIAKCWNSGTLNLSGDQGWASGTLDNVLMERCHDFRHILHSQLRCGNCIHGFEISLVNSDRFIDLVTFLDICQAMIESMRCCVPEEPSADSAVKLCTFRIRFPNGEQQQRKFLATHTLQVHIQTKSHKQNILLCTCLDSNERDSLCVER